jgi:hypothetical protein
LFPVLSKSPKDKSNEGALLDVDEDKRGRAGGREVEGGAEGEKTEGREAEEREVEEGEVRCEVMAFVSGEGLLKKAVIFCVHASRQ